MVEAQYGLVTVKFKNDYEKAVNAFQVGEGAISITLDFIQQHDWNAMLPGETWENVYPSESLSAMNEFTIFGVVFEDGSGEGRPSTIRAIKEMRKGAKIFLSRVKPLMEAALVASKQETDANIVQDKFESDIAALPIDPEEKSSHFMRVGMNNEKPKFFQKSKNKKNKRAVNEYFLSISRRSEFIRAIFQAKKRPLHSAEPADERSDERFQSQLIAVRRSSH